MSLAHLLRGLPADDSEQDIKMGPNMFSDGLRTVDFVLVWMDENVSSGKRAQIAAAENARIKREIFERNLCAEGLSLEYEDASEKLHFIKIHASKEVLARYTEILKLRMPMKRVPDVMYPKEENADLIKEVKSFVKKVLHFVRVDESTFPPLERTFTAEFSRDKKYLFDMDDPDFFSHSVRATVVDFILERKKFSDKADEVFAFGINRMTAASKDLLLLRTTIGVSSSSRDKIERGPWNL